MNMIFVNGITIILIKIIIMLIRKIMIGMPLLTLSMNDREKCPTPSTKPSLSVFEFINRFLNRVPSYKLYLTH